jgi:hypothetical protein
LNTNENKRDRPEDTIDVVLSAKRHESISDVIRIMKMNESGTNCPCECHWESGSPPTPSHVRDNEPCFCKQAPEPVFDGLLAAITECHYPIDDHKTRCNDSIGYGSTMFCDFHSNIIKSAHDKGVDCKPCPAPPKIERVRTVLSLDEQQTDMCITVGCHEPSVPESDVGAGPMLCKECYIKNDKSQHDLNKLADMCLSSMGFVRNSNLTPIAPPNSPVHAKSDSDKLKNILTSQTTIVDWVNDHAVLLNKQETRLHSHEGNIASLGQQLAYNNRKLDQVVHGGEKYSEMIGSLLKSIDSLSARISTLEVVDIDKYQRPIQLGRALTRDDGETDTTAEARAMKMTGQPVLTPEQEQKSISA